MKKINLTRKESSNLVKEMIIRLAKQEGYKSCNVDLSGYNFGYVTLISEYQGTSNFYPLVTLRFLKQISSALGSENICITEMYTMSSDLIHKAEDGMEDNNRFKFVNKIIISCKDIPKYLSTSCIWD